MAEDVRRGGYLNGVGALRSQSDRAGMELHSPDYSDLSSEQPAQGQPDCLANRVTPAPAVSASIVGRPDLKLERSAYGAPSLWTIRAPLGNLRLPDKRETFFHPPGWCTCHTSGPNC